MTAMLAVERMTAEEYLAHYDPMRRREELVGGVIVMHEPRLRHEFAAADDVLVFRRSKPDGPAFDVSLELKRSETLTSPLLPGFALPLAAVFGE